MKPRICKYCNGTGKRIVKAVGNKKKYHMNFKGGYSYGDIWPKDYPDADSKCPHCLGTGVRR